MVGKNSLNKEQTIKVVQIQIFTASSGKAAIRLHNAFIQRGIDSTIITLKHEINDDDKVIQKGMKPKLVAWIDNKIQSYVTSRYD